jgi:hypothetical protein
VLIVGGFDNSGNALSSCEIYDPSANTWSFAASIPQARTLEQRGLYQLDSSNNVFLTGGYYDSAVGGTFQLAYQYDPIGNIWTATNTMTHRRGGFGEAFPVIVGSQNVIFVAGGQDWTAGGTNNYTPTAEIWSPLTPVILPPPYRIPDRVAAAIEKDIFGVDLLWTNDLKVTPKGDWQEVNGLDNLRRAIYRRLMVKPGEYRLRPTYGVGVGLFVKRAMPKSRLDELRQRIVEQLSREKRIDKIVEVLLTPTTFGHDTGLVIKITVQVGGQIVRFKPFSFAQER